MKQITNKKFFLLTILCFQYFSATLLSAAPNPAPVNSTTQKNSITPGQEISTLFERVSSKYKEWLSFLVEAELFTPEEKKIFAEMEKEILKNSPIKQ